MTTYRTQCRLQRRLIEADSFHHAATVAANYLFEIPCTVERLATGADPHGHDYVIQDDRGGVLLVMNVARPKYLRGSHQCANTVLSAAPNSPTATTRSAPRTVSASAMNVSSR